MPVRNGGMWEFPIDHFVMLGIAEKISCWVQLKLLKRAGAGAGRSESGSCGQLRSLGVVVLVSNRKARGCLLVKELGTRY
jgi:hypothetical protein